MANQFKIGKGNTTIVTKNGITNITFHSTVVVSFDDKTITLDSGGWLTKTTKDRMNQTSNQFDLGFNVYQKNGNWYIDFKNSTTAFGDGIKLLRYAP